MDVAFYWLMRQNPAYSVDTYSNIFKEVYSNHNIIIIDIISLYRGTADRSSTFDLFAEVVP